MSRRYECMAKVAGFLGQAHTGDPMIRRILTKFSPLFEKNKTSTPLI